MMKRSHAVIIGLVFGVLEAGTLSVAAENEPDLWSLREVVRPAVPAEAGHPHPIDAFVVKKLREKGLHPVERTDKATLLRRVYYDLIGLPPTRGELNAFLRDDSADAYLQVVDRLLADPQHGVRYARHWLDVLRYADVHESTGNWRCDERTLQWPWPLFNGR